MKKIQTLEQKVKFLLEEPFWLNTLVADKVYSRLHDDHDGTFIGHVSIQFTRDGDAWLNIVARPMETLRFRMPFSGGGTSPRVRNALMILAEAIRLDNEENPLETPDEK